jgi:hypothetical protein
VQGVTSSRYGASRDRDRAGRPRNARPRDALGRPLDRTAPARTTDDPAPLSPAEALRTAQQLLDDGQPFAAHEVLEAVWKHCAGPERELWRGLAQLAVGVTHALRGNEIGAHSLLRRGHDNLAGYAGTTPEQVDVDGILAWARIADEDLRNVTPPPRLAAPR